VKSFGLALILMFVAAVVAQVVLTIADVHDPVKHFVCGLFSGAAAVYGAIWLLYQKPPP
jgi:hypothetical protein